MENIIVTIGNKKSEKFLRKKTEDFNFEKTGGPERVALVERMKATMRAANGIGLSANQIGLAQRAFVAEIPERNGGTKFYAVFNPELELRGKENAEMEEGCLSVPGVYGVVSRPRMAVLRGFDKNGHPIKIKAWGLLARVFQHELDHLNGVLFIDKARTTTKNHEKWHRERGA